MGLGPRRRIFISYTGEDVAYATWIAAVLRGAGHEVTIQAEDFRPGLNFVAEVQRALTSADHVLAVLSPAYEASAFTGAEWAAAFVSDPTGVERKLIGVRIRDYRPAGLLAPIVYVDIFGQTDEEAATRITTAIQSGELSTTLPSFPGNTSTQSIGDHGTPRLVPHFAGRDGALAEISAGLDSSDRLAITGFGGIGKTSVASAWVRQHSAEFDISLWLYTPTRQRAAEAIDTASRQLGLIGHDADPAAAEVALHRYLAQVDRTLVVLDDCPDSDLASVLCASLTAKVLVTSRNDAGWTPAGYRQHRLDVLRHGAAVAVLQSAAPNGGDGAEAVATALGGLPLALAQAAAYVDRHGISFADYVDRLSTYAPRVFEEPPGHDYGRTVLSAWSLALDELEEAEPAAASILKLLAFVDVNDFPRGALLVGHHVLTEPLASVAGDAFELDGAIACLLRQSLCRPEGDGLSIHPVIQGVIASRLGAEEAEATVRSAVALLRMSMPDGDEPPSWTTWERLSPHAVTAATELARRGIYSDDFMPLMADVARFSTRRGFPHYGNYLYRLALDYLLRHRDRSSWNDVLFVMEELGHSFLSLRAAGEAMHVFRSLVEVAECAEQLDSRGAIAARVGLASSLTDTGGHDEAVAQLAQAAEAFERLPGTDPSLGVRVYGTWGRLLVRIGKPKEGRHHLEKALTFAEVTGNDADTSLTHLHIGNSFRGEGNPMFARAHYDRALENAGRLRDSHALRAEVLANLGGVARDTGDSALALDYTEQALQCLEEVPEGGYSVTAALLRYQRAQLRSRLPGVSVAEVLAETRDAFEIACDHLPVGHPLRRQIARFLLHIADALDDDTIRSSVNDREPH